MWLFFFGAGGDGYYRGVAIDQPMGWCQAVKFSIDTTFTDQRLLDFEWNKYMGLPSVHILRFCARNG